MITLQKIPTSEEYESEVSKIEAKLVKAKNDYDYHYNRQMIKNQASRCAGMRGFTGGMTSCDYWKLQSRNIWNNEMKPKYQGQIDSAKRELEEYQNAVISVRDLENKRKIEEHLQEQAQIIEDRITETFRVQSEAFMQLQQASTVATDQTLTQTVGIDNETGFNEKEKLQSQQGLQGSFFPIMLMGIMLS